MVVLKRRSELDCHTHRAVGCLHLLYCLDLHSVWSSALWCPVFCVDNRFSRHCRNRNKPSSGCCGQGGPAERTFNGQQGVFSAAHYAQSESWCSGCHRDLDRTRRPRRCEAKYCSSRLRHQSPVTSYVHGAQSWRRVCLIHRNTTVVEHQPLQQSLHYQSFECQLLSIKTPAPRHDRTDLHLPVWLCSTMSCQTCIHNVRADIDADRFIACGDVNCPSSQRANVAAGVTRTVCASSCRLLRRVWPPAGAVSSTSWSPTATAQGMHPITRHWTKLPSTLGSHQITISSQLRWSLLALPMSQLFTSSRCLQRK